MTSHLCSQVESMVLLFLWLSARPTGNWRRNPLLAIVGTALSHSHAMLELVREGGKSVSLQTQLHRHSSRWLDLLSKDVGVNLKETDVLDNSLEGKTDPGPLLLAPTSWRRGEFGPSLKASPSQAKPPNLTLGNGCMEGSRRDEKNETFLGEHVQSLALAELHNVLGHILKERSCQCLSVSCLWSHHSSIVEEGLCRLT